MQADKPKYTSIGGQALIEGVMMRGKDQIAIAVRKPDGEIEIKMDKVGGLEKLKIAKIPFIRGVVSLVSSMIVGVRALTYSAEFYIEEEAAEDKDELERRLQKIFGDHTDDVIMGFSILTAFLFAMILFGVLPTFVVGLLRRFVHESMTLSIIEGVMKIAFFIIYVASISRMKDIQRVFQYHGAEHKTIHCFESGQPVTVENAKKFTTLHPRCGTSFIFFVLIISIILFSFISWNSIIMRIFIKLLLLPLVAGISYEVLKLAGKSDNGFIKAISKPGLMMQNLTTAEPDDSQLEVAIAAFNAVLATMGEEAQPQ
jgi:uncharacterized protein YqhQ